MTPSLSSLDLTGCTGLLSLNLNRAGLSALDASTCTALTTLVCTDAGYLTSLDVTGLTNLTSLELGDCVSLLSLDVSTCPALRVLDVNGCTNLATLDVTGCANLEELDAETTALTALDVSTCPALTAIDLYGATVTGELNISGLTNLITSGFSTSGGATIHSIDMSNAVITGGTLNLYGLALETINVTNSSGYTGLDVDGNDLTTLDCSTLTALQELDCYNMGSLTTLDVSGCVALTTLCAGDNLASLDVTGLTALTTLICYGNNGLSDITGFSDCTALADFECGHCALTALDISNNPLLGTNVGFTPGVVDASNNQLTTVAVDGILESLVFSGQFSGSVNLSGDTNASPSDTNLVMAGNFTVGSSMSGTITQATSLATATYVSASPYWYIWGNPSGTFTPSPSATFTQASTGATATFVRISGFTYAMYSLVVSSLSSSPAPNNTDVWSDGVGNTFTPASNYTDGTPSQIFTVTSVSGEPNYSDVWTDESGNTISPASIEKPWVPATYTYWLNNAVGWTVTTN